MRPIRQVTCYLIILLIIVCGMVEWRMTRLAYAAEERNYPVHDIQIHVSRDTKDEAGIRYTTGGMSYMESLTHGHWVGRWLGAADEVTSPDAYWLSDAFEIRISPKPASSESILIQEGWKWVSWEEVQQARQSQRCVHIHLCNQSQPVGLTIRTLLDGTAIMKRDLLITNTSNAPLALTGLSPWSGRIWNQDAEIRLGHSIRHEIAMEGWFGWTTLEAGVNLFKQDKGIYSDDPYFLLQNRNTGEYAFGQLAWEANYSMEFTKDHGLTFKAGPLSKDALRVIAPGETITTPSTHLGLIRGDFDDAVQTMHDHFRRSVLPQIDPDRCFRVQYLIPEDQPLTVYRGDAYNEESVKKCMDVAALAGVEAFIVDGPTWAEGTTPGVQNPGQYGIWLPRKKWFPNGFEPLVEYAHGLGMFFGIYAEPEGGRGDWTQTEAYKEHPEWFTTRRPLFPGPCFINMAIPGAADYVESEIHRIIEANHLDLYRHDQNGVEGGEGSSTLREGFQENDYWRHYEALRRIMAQVRKDYPHLILQQAAAGGCRMDLASMSLWQESFTSDNCSWPHVYQAAAGLSVYLPPEVLVVANGMAGNGRNQPDLTTMLREVYMLGHTPMIFNAMLPKSVDEFSPEMREKFQKYNRLFKDFARPLLPTLKVYHHAPVNSEGGVESGPWFAMEFFSPDRLKGWALVIRLDNVEHEGYPLKLKGPDPAKKYHVTLDNTGQTRAISGSDLIEKGLHIEVGKEPASELVMLEGE